MFFEVLVCLLGKHGVAINDVNVNKTGEVKIDIDFSEHDKPFKVKIRELEESYQKNVREIHTLEKDNLFFKQRITEIENKRNKMYEISKILRKNCNNFYKENKELKQRIAELESKETEKPTKYTTVIVAKEINGQEYVRLDDFMSVVNDLQAEIGT